MAKGKRWAQNKRHLTTKACWCQPTVIRPVKRTAKADRRG